MHAYKFNKVEAIYLKGNYITNEGLNFPIEASYNSFKSL